MHRTARPQPDSRLDTPELNQMARGIERFVNILFSFTDAFQMGNQMVRSKPRRQEVGALCYGESYADRNGFQ